MYEPKDEADNRAQLRARLLGAGIPALALLALTLVSFFLRWPEALTIVFSCLTGFLCLFAYRMLLFPVLSYGRHLRHALHGRTRQTEGTLMALETERVLREGIYFHPMTLNVGDPAREEDNRLFYLDANLPLPDWRTGERLLLTSYDNRVTAWERPAASASNA